MKLMNRRSVVKAGLAGMPLLVRAAPPQPPAANVTAAAASATSTGGLAPAALVNAWSRGFAAAPGTACAWWSAGTLYSHVDGLREFPVLMLNAIMLCRTTQLADALVVDWRTFGYFSDLDSGAPATHWDNVFTGTRQSVPPRFGEGPGRYRLSTHDATLTLNADRVRSNHINLTGADTADGFMLTQIEGTLQGLPRLDGTLPPLDSPAVTERQTRLQWVMPRASESRLPAVPPGPLSGSGFFNHVYDALPSWLGFGERLGSALSKGVMRRAGVDEVVNPVVRSRIDYLFGALARSVAAPLP
jgi:hypothetical protein